MTSLASLRAAFDADRARVLATAAPAESTPANVCRYCGKFRNYSATKMDGHARCYVGLEFMQLVDEALRPADVTVRMIADALGVTRAAVDTWCRIAQSRERKDRKVSVTAKTFNRVADSARRGGTTMAAVVAKATEGVGA